METYSIYKVTFIDGNNIEIRAVSIRKAVSSAEEKLKDQGRMPYRGEIVKVECLIRV
jgi:hypothetical protein